MNILLLYFILKLSAIQVFFVVWIIILGIWLIIWGFIWSVNVEYGDTAMIDLAARRTKCKIVWFSMFLCLIVTTLMPTTNQAIVLYALPKIVNNQHVQQVPANFAKIVDAKMKEWLNTIEEEGVAVVKEQGKNLIEK